MKKHFLLNTVFISGLILLLLNDHFLKAQFGNWFTGKLSDFAGLLIFPLFLRFVFPVSARQAIGITFLGFLFWKSPFVQPLLDAYNALGIWPVSRVVDYSDYLAFLMLPLSYYVLEHVADFRLRIGFKQQWQLNAILTIAVFAFVATSTEDDLLINDPTITACCQDAPVEADLGNGKFFIPTIFTPDGNGVNDYFQVTADANILRIDTFWVFDLANGDTVFYQTNMTDITPENGFDGVYQDTIMAAQYGYSIWLTSSDQQRSLVSGLICSVPCVDPLNIAEPMNISNCAFASQHNFITGYDPSADSGEDLDCF
ncbi:hypothetical protein [Lewinella sp. LCG006]|uniref:hypothetical protein n=1 Tax=Lewinella sp. LCG006 TaxID=3231911 RepID=UPI0034609307